MDKYGEVRVPIAKDNVSIKRDEAFCVLCGKCKDVCKKQIGVAGFWKYDSEDIVCINCGQCANLCPTRAITEIDEGEKLTQFLADKTKTVVFMTSPSVRVSLGELFDLPVGTNVEKKMVGALKALNGKYVFDVTFGADITIMEEATELVHRIKENLTLPMFTSCCPAWVKFVETFYPQYIPNLSTCKSPISMQASLIKNYFSKVINVDPKDIVVCAVTPCVAKKFEAKRKELAGDYGQDTDIVLSAREIARVLKQRDIDLNKVEDAEFDSVFGRGTGAGVIFGASGGVMEAAVRTAYYLTTNQNPPADLLHFEAVRGNASIKRAEIELLGKTLKLCVVYGTANARTVLDNMGTEPFDYLEVMTCPNGCVGGGGQPIQYDNDGAVVKRANGLYAQDETMPKRCSHENEEVKKVYDEFLITPCSEKAEQYLHTTYQSR